MKTFEYVVLGSGVAAGFAVQEFAKQPFTKGKVAIITADRLPPYDRPPLSKAFLAGQKGIGEIFINNDLFYQENGIEVITNQSISQIDFRARKLIGAGGEEFGYAKLLIATGSHPRRLDVPGAELNGVHYLRSVEDAEAIQTDAQTGRRAVVIGAGFIGMEAASVLASKGVEVTIVFPQGRVWEKFFTPEMSAFFQGYFEQRRVRFLPREKVIGLTGKGRVSGVQLDSGYEAPADFVVAGIGVTPALQIFENSELQIEDGVLVNEYLETSVPGVWAAGDITNFPDAIFQKRRRVEHWDNAVEQGRLAARNLMGGRAPFRRVLYFFSDVFELSYEFWGDTVGHDEVVHRGDMSHSSFSTWWLKNSRLVAAFILNRPDEERELAPGWIRQHMRLDVETLQNEQWPLYLLSAA